jgi:hypothetical protein
MIARLTEKINGNNITTSVYPNPTIGMVTLHVSDGTLSPDGIIITDDIGRTYSSKLVQFYSKSVQVDLSGFRSGVYFIKIKVDNSFKTFKVVKK